MGRSNLPSSMRPAQPSPGAEAWTNLLWGAHTHEAVADSLADKAHRLDPAGTLPTLRPLRQMVSDHRIKAMLMRGQAAALSGAPIGSR